MSAFQEPINSSLQLSICFPHSARDRSNQSCRTTARASTETLDHRSCCTAASEPEKLSDRAHQSFNCIPDLSKGAIRLISVWDKCLIYGHHFLSRQTTSRVQILRARGSNRPRHSALAQADRLTERQVRETQRHQRQHAHPRGKVAQQQQRRAFNSWLGW